eukprot:Hpha_TRINITY_DN30910_c0_g1::TRINITY_DN30910_c0_g1_i1::g.112333::m.112333/K19008/SIK1; serine/threonine-protein kinase SIK1
MPTQCCVCRARAVLTSIPVCHDVASTFAVDSFASLGAGANSGVYVGRICPSPSRGSDHSAPVGVAVKLVRKQLLNPPALSLLSREISLLKALCHPNIAAFAAVAQDDRTVAIATELCPAGDLWGFIRRRGTLSEREMRTGCLQLLSVLRYLHREVRVTHRDLKCENVVVSAIGADGWLEAIKVVDWGAAKWYGGPGGCPNPREGEGGCCHCGSCRGGDRGECVSSPRGTIQCCPPEVLESMLTMGARPRVVRGWEIEAVDLWGVGVVGFEMVCGRRPYISPGWVAPKDLREEVEQVAGMVEQTPEEELPLGLSGRAKEFLQGLLEKDPLDRIRLDDACQHQFLRSHSPPLRPTPARSPGESCGISTNVSITSDAAPSDTTYDDSSPKRRRLSGCA